MELPSRLYITFSQFALCAKVIAEAGQLKGGALSNLTTAPPPQRAPGSVQSLTDLSENSEENVSLLPSTPGYKLILVGDRTSLCSVGLGCSQRTRASGEASCKQSHPLT